MQDPFVQQLICHLDGFMSGFKDSLMPNNYQALVGILTSEVAQRFEKVILKTDFNRVIAIAWSCSCEPLRPILKDKTLIFRLRFHDETNISNYFKLL